VIQEKDDELWQAGLTFFTTARPSLTQSHSNLRRNLQQLCQSIDHTHYQFWYAHAQFVTDLQRPFITNDTKRIFEIITEHLIKALPKDIRENPYHTQFAEKDIRALEANKFLTNSVYKLCLQLFSRGNHSELARIWKYRGGNPDDIRWLPQDISFLTMQMSGIAHTAQVYIAQDHQLPYHPETYVYQYYFLCLAFLLHQQASINTFFSHLHVQFAERILMNDGEVADSFARELRQRHIFLQNLPYHLGKVIAQADKIIALRDEALDKLFDDQFLSAINNAMGWLESEELNDCIARDKASIENYFPRNVRVVQQYRQQFESTYVPLNKRICPIEHPHCLLSEARQTTPTKTVFSRLRCLPKTTFTLLKANPEHKVLEIISQLIHSIYEDEHRFLISEIGLHNYTSTSLNVLDRASFQQITDQLVDLYYTDYLILFLPSSDAFVIERVVGGEILSNGTSQTWIVQTPSRSMPIFVHSLHSLQKRAYLLQPTAIQWTVHVEPTIALTNCPNNGNNVHLGANGVVKCDVVFPKGIIEIAYQTIETVEDRQNLFL
jgi:hypothetical protein